MTIKYELLKVADKIEEKEFYPHALEGPNGGICFVNAELLTYTDNITRHLSRAIPFVDNGIFDPWNINPKTDAAILWAMQHNLSTKEAVLFVREVAEFYD